MKNLILFLTIIIFYTAETKAQNTESLTVDIGSVNSSDPVNKPHMLGVIAGPAPNYSSTAPDLTGRYQDIGVTTVRNNDYFDDRLDMERMFFCGTYPITATTTPYPNWNCDPNVLTNYHFTESDVQFQNWVNGGFLPFFRLGGENSHNINQHDYKGPRSYEEDEWLKAGLKVVDRYNTFGGSSNTLQGYLNLWTEYPQKQFWDRDSLSFNNFWCTNFDSLKNHFPSLKIGGPGFNTSISTALGNTTNGTVNTHINLFLRELKLRNLKPGWIGFHVFSNNIDDFYKTAVNFRKLLRAEAPFTAYSSVWGNGDNSFFHGVELICDAWGFDNDQNLSSTTRDSLFNKQRGATHHTGAFIALQHADVERAYIYRGGEFGTGTTNGVMGLFYGDPAGTYKPVAHGFRLCSKMQTIFNKKLVSPVTATASAGGKIWTLSGEDAIGRKAILISNPTTNTIHLALTVNNIPLSTTLYTYVDHYSVTDLSTGQTGNAWTGGTFVLPPYTSHLITLSNSATGIDAPTIDKKNVTLYPNPCQDKITFSETLNDIKVYDVYGRAVLSECHPAKSISVHNLDNGIYILHSDNKILKFVIAK